MIAALARGARARTRATAALRGVLLDAEGPHFSFGASVEEHLPAQCARDARRAARAHRARCSSCPAPILVAVRGQCLGGGLEVALAGSLIFAAPDAQLGQPEMKLGVFAPAASVLLPLPRRRRPARKTCCCPAARSAPTRRCAIGLVHAVADDPAAAALAWFDAHLARQERGVARATRCARRAAARIERDARRRSPTSSGSTSRD